MPKNLHSPALLSRILLALLMGLSVSATAQITVNFAVTQPMCFGLPTGSVTASASGSVGPYTYLWNTGQTGPTITGITAGNYSVLVTSSNGQSTTANVTVTQPALIQGTITVDDLCSAPFTLTVVASGGVFPYNYYWSGGASTTPVLANVPAGSYCVTITDVNLCGAVECITVNSNPPSVNVVVGNVTCPGGNNGTLTANPIGGQPPYTYVWSNGATGQTINNLTAGTYTVTLTDASGCTASATGTVTQPPPIVINLNGVGPTCPGGTNGSINASVSGGTPPYTLLWNTGQTTPFLTNVGVGLYILTVTDSRGCIQTASINLQTVSNLNVGAVGTPLTCPGINNGTATASVTGAVQPVIYLWNTGANTQQITGLAPGTYTVTVTDGVGCQRSASAIVADAPAFTLAVTGTNATTCGVSNGTATVNIIAGAGPFTYLWNTGANTPTISGLGSGTFSVTVTNGAGCVATGQVTITQPPNVFVTVMGSTSVCPGATTGTASAIVSGGTPPFNYAWSNGGNSATLNNLPAGNYQVTVTDATGCTATGQITINQSPGVSINVTGTTVVCGPGATGTATVFINTGTPPYNILWSNGATTTTVSNLAEGTYTVTVTDANGCQASGSISVNVVDDLAVNFARTNVLCFGQNTGSATAQPSGGNGPYSYLWNTGATTQTINNLGVGTYSVTVTDNNGCTVAGQVTITQPTDLTVSIVPSVNAVCFGQATGTLTANAMGGTPAYTYAWSNGQTGPTISNLPAGTYTVTVTDMNECTETASFTLTQSPQLTATVDGNTVECGAEDSGAAGVQVAGGTPPYTYMWNTGATTESIDGLTSGTYTVTVSDNLGCTAEAQITIVVVSDFNANLTPRAVLCFGGNTGSVLAIPSGGAQPYTYLWSNGSTANEITGLTAGTYSVTITEANGCSLTQMVTITQPSQLTVNATGDNADCFGLANGSATAVGAGGTPPYNYAWSNGATGATASNLAAGTYTVTATDANFCTATTTVNITQPTAVQANITGSTNVACFGGATGSATVAGSGGTPPYTFAWSNGATTATASNLAAGSYTVTVSDANGCTATATANITQTAALLVTVTQNSATCLGENDGILAANVSGGTAPFTYAWSNGGNTQAISGLAAGVYMVTVTDAQGCTGSATAAVSAFPSPTCVAEVLTQAFNGNDGSMTVNPNGGVPPYTYLWSNGQTTQTISNLTSAFYTVTVTDANGCQTSCGEMVFGPSRVTGRVWLDNDRDGLQDPPFNEPGIPGIMVIINTVIDQDFPDTTFTNGVGDYFFDVPPGTYKITWVIPAIYEPTLPNVGANDNIDSDMDPVTFMTEVFTLAKGQNTDYDAGLTLECVNITNPGSVCCYQFLCGPGNDPAPITNVTFPSGGTGAIEYLWMYTTGNPNVDIQFWTPIPNSNTPGYDPGPLYQTTYFVRCARREDCTIYLESNIVQIEVGSVSVANIQGPSQVCEDDEVTFFAVGQQANAVISWDFGPAAIPQFATGAQVDVRFFSFGSFNIRLTVTQNGCTATRYRQISVINNPTLCGGNLTIDAEALNNDAGEVMVRWQMPTTVEPLTYLVQHAPDGHNFTTIGTVDAPARTQNGLHHYEYLDQARKKGRNFYRVLVMDHDGNIAMSDIAEVIVFTDSRLAMIYPNPVEDVVTLEIFETFDEEVVIELTNASGIVLQRQRVAPGVSTQQLDLRNYPAGAYFVRLTYGRTSVKTMKVLKR